MLARDYYDVERLGPGRHLSVSPVSDDAERIRIRIAEERGEAVKIWVRYATPPLDDSDKAATLHWFIAEVDALISESRRVGGIVVGVAGKWRKWERPAA